jgi:CheY-like chemotaxis protein
MTPVSALIPHASLSARPAFVLIVDDEAQNRMLLRDPLEGLGYEAAEAENGAEALRKVADRPPDVILLDIMMPQLDGFEVCRRLKRNEKTAPIPILLVTALSDRKERLMGIQAGANDFLTKPVDIQDLTLRVANAAHAKHLFDQLHAEQEKSDLLLDSVLPAPIAQRMKAGELSIADSHTDVTVLYANLAGFSALTAFVAPEQVVHILNEIFSAFDQLLETRGLEKIKTIGDSYLAAGGIYLPNPRHAEAAAQAALDMTQEVERFNFQYNTSIRLRIGLSSGPVIAGVVGGRRFTYDLWGETVNAAVRLSSQAEAGTICVAAATCQKLESSFELRRLPLPPGNAPHSWPAAMLAASGRNRQESQLPGSMP